MAVLGKEELLAKVKAIIGENDSDEALALLEDVSDTITEHEKRNEGKEDWKAKYEENDKAWRKKYRDRFLSKPENPEPEEEDEDEHDEPEKKLTYNDLFKEE